MTTILAVDAPTSLFPRGKVKGRETTGLVRPCSSGRKDNNHSDFVRAPLMIYLFVEHSAELVVICVQVLTISKL